ncbi:serine hydrolase domain-containing protein [Flavobacterium caeni]|uniref:CubicO group peptidase, beta-lactamase class C family n=1 Tax=Flavobacterium caeni TaxID=490189 RepID=A0A1G5FBK6_9FLAO|nr:serine hydrolase domain-containing protein [Flavobacterium caeni]SCY36639.1 CubicO group peptidase, beta-lactamase class C family [Flavobacterium caeni]
MRKISLFVLTLAAQCCFGQKNVRFADSIRSAYHIPELSYAVVGAESTLEIAATGNHSAALPDGATLDDRFHIGSNTKAMTAFIIAKYVEKGKLNWNTRFFSLFPEWEKASKPEYRHITLQQLLSHRAGIQPFQGENDPPIPGFKGTKQERRRQFGQFVLGLAPATADSHQPFVYSNAGYTLATLMLEKATGKSWEQLVEKVFNKDLRLDVKFSWPENQKRKDTWGHSYENGQLIPIPSTAGYSLDFTEPAGDLNMTLKNYVKFIQLNLQGLAGQDNYLKAATYRFIHEGVDNYAMGWFNIHENGNVLSVHSGTGAFTYFTIAHIDRIGNKAYIIFANSFNDDTQQGVRVLMRKLKERYRS